MNVLRKNREYLSYFGLGVENTIQFVRISVPRIFLAILFGFMLVVGVLCNILLIIGRIPEGIAALVFPIACCLTFISFVFNFLSLIAKRDLICELFDYVAVVVDKSKYSWFFFRYRCNVIRSQSIIFCLCFFCIGSSLSMEASKTYDETEASNGDFFQKAAKFCFFVFFLAVNAPPFAFPLLYAIVSWPPPDLWFTSYGLENAYDLETITSKKYRKI